MDRIRERWGETQDHAGRALDRESDVVDIVRLDPQRFVARFHCRGAVREKDVRVLEGGPFVVGYRFGEDYLRRVNPLDVVTWLAPRNAFHPNLDPPRCCLGDIIPGTPLVDLVYRTYELISYQNVMPDERDALDPRACQWARAHQELFPLDDRPLKRRARAVRVETQKVPR